MNTKKSFYNSFLVLFLVAFITILSGCSFLGELGGLIDDVNGDDNNGTETLEIKKETAAKNLEDLGLKDGYEIAYYFENSEGEQGKYLMGRKGNTIWLLLASSQEDDYDSGFAVVQDGSKFHLYTYDVNEGGFVFDQTYEDEESVNSVESFYQYGFNFWIYFGFSFDGQYKKAGTATVCGRNCEKYEYSKNYGINILKMKYIVYVDKALGITLKLEYEASSQGEGEAMSFEVNSFKTGNSVSIPTLPEPVKNQEQEGEE